jgi:hypothetical protein
MSGSETVANSGGGEDEEYTEAGADPPRNFPRIAARIVPQDQREAIRPGILISHYASTNAQDQPG